MKKLVLYKQIQEDIVQKIKSGQLRPTDRVPSEQELMDEFKVSKITVKNALTQLADEGLIIRVQGKGTFVSSSIDSPLSPHSASSLPLIGFIIPTMVTRVIQKLVDYTEQFLSEAGPQHGTKHHARVLLYRIERHSYTNGARCEGTDRFSNRR